MTDISLLQYARLLGSNTVIGMAERVGLKPPPPPISVRNLIDLAGRIILPFAPVDLQPQNGARGIRNDPSLFFRDSGAGTPAAAAQFEFSVTQNNVLVDPTKRLTDLATTSNPLPPFGIKWFFPLPPGEVTLTVRAINKAGKGPKSSSIFSVTSSPVPQPHHRPRRQAWSAYLSSLCSTAKVSDTRCLSGYVTQPAMVPGSRSKGFRLNSMKQGSVLLMTTGIRLIQ